MNYAQLERIIIDAKNKYTAVFSTIINQEVYIWRLLTSSELEIINKTSIGEQYLKEELICEAVVIYPEVDFATYKAGVPSVLAPLILDESGFSGYTKTKELLSKARVKIFSDFQEQANIVIASAFPQYRIEEIKGWDVEKLTTMVARAEWKLNVIDGKDFFFEDVKEEEEVEEKSEKEKLQELEGSLIEKGYDPILVLYNSVYKEDKPYLPEIFAMGRNFDREDVIDVVRKNIQQRLSNS